MILLHLPSINYSTTQLVASSDIRCRRRVTLCAAIGDISTHARNHDLQSTGRSQQQKKGPDCGA